MARLVGKGLMSLTFSTHCAMPAEEYIAEKDLGNSITWGSDVPLGVDSSSM